MRYSCAKCKYTDMGYYESPCRECDDDKHSHFATVDGWIPCELRLPEDGQTVIFTAKEVVEDDGSKFVEAGVYDAKKGWCYNDGYFPNAFTFVAWLPLPEPYMEQNNE